MALGPVVEVTIACEDTRRSSEFLRQILGWEVLDTMTTDLLLGFRDSPTGRVRLTRAEANEYGSSLPPPVWQPGPRTLSVYSRDVHRSRVLFEQAGGKVGDVFSYESIPGRWYSECMGLDPTGIYWFFPNPSIRLSSPALEQDEHRVHGELHAVGVNVAEIEAARDFFVEAGGLKVLIEKVVRPRAQPELRAMMGLPQDVVFCVMLLGTEDEEPARLELLSYEGLPVSAAWPGNVGIKQVSFAATDIEETTARLVAAGGRDSGRGSVIGPAGLEIKLQTRT